MTVGQAKAIAQEWLRDHAPQVPGLHGVYLAGSTNAQADMDDFGFLSDIDLHHVVHGDPGPPFRQSRQWHRGIIIEASYYDYKAYRDADTVLGSFWVACHFSVPSVVWDPTGQLTAVQRQVADRFADPLEIRRRCQDVLSGTHVNLVALTGSGNMDERIVNYFFASNNVCQLPLVASLRFPTFRRAGMLYTDTMTSLGKRDLAEDRLRALGSVGMTRVDVECLLSAAELAYDRALRDYDPTIEHNPWLSEASRHIMIDGSRDIIERGYHREAVFWVMTSHIVAAMELKATASEEYECNWRAPYQHLLDVLEIGSPEALSAKAAAIEQLLERTMAVSESMIQRREL